MDFLFLLTPLVYLGVTLAAANRPDDPRAQTALRALLLGFPVLLAFAALRLLALSGAPATGVSAPELLLIFGYNLFAAFAAAALTLRPSARALLSRLLRGRFAPDSPVHRTAAVLMLTVIGLVSVNFAAGGGAAGYAQALETQGISPVEPVLTAALFVALALMGVGWRTRRMLPEALARLGLTRPTLRDVVVGIGAAWFFYVILSVGAAALLLTNPDALGDTRAAQQIALNFATLPLAFLLSASAAVGEELLIRGALQPVFGIVLSSVFFTALHVQYWLSPFTLVIFALSLSLGTLRARYNTTTAIAAHFTFNFVQLALLSLSVQTS